MARGRRNRTALVHLVAVAALWLGGCTFHLAPDLEPPRPGDAGDYLCRGAPIDATVVVAVPRDFREFVFEGALNHREISYAFGEATREPLRALLESCFERVRVEEIPEDRLSMLAVLERFADATVDQVALARFTRVSLRATTFDIGLELTLELEFLSGDGAAVFAVEGDGTGTAHVYLSSPLRAAGREALGGALASLRSRLENWAVLLVPEA